MDNMPLMNIAYGSSKYLISKLLTALVRGHEHSNAFLMHGVKSEEYVRTLRAQFEANAELGGALLTETISAVHKDAEDRRRECSTRKPRKVRK